MKARVFRLWSFALLSLLTIAPLASAQGKPDLRWMRGGHSAYLTRLAYAANGTFFVSAAQDNTLKIWRASDNLLLRTIVVEGGSAALALSPDDSTVCADGHFPDNHPFVACWQVADGALLWKTLIPGSVPNEGAGALGFSPDGQHLASIANFSFKIWRVADGVPIADYRNPLPGYGYGDVAYSPDGAVLATNSGDDSQLVLLNPSTGALLWDSGVSGSFGYDLAFSPDSQLVAAVNGIGLRVFGTYDHLQKPFDIGSPATKIAFSRNGSRIASSGYKSVPGGFTSFVNLFDTATGALIRSWDGHGFGSVASGPVAFNADSTRLLSGVLDIKKWNATNGNFDSLVTGQVAPVRWLAMSANEQVVATAATTGAPNIDEHVISLFRASDGALLRYIDYGPVPLRGLALSPDGKHVAAGDVNGLRVWNVSTGALERSHAEYGGLSFYRPLAYSPDGKTIAESGDLFGGVEIWNPTTDAITTITGDSASFLQYLPDGKLALGLANSVKIVTGAGALVRTIPGLSNQASMAVSPDGSMVAAGGTDAAFSPAFVARVWRVSDGATLQTLAGHTKTIVGVGFSWDSQTVLTGAQDSSVRIWRVSDGVQARLYDQETGVTQGMPTDGVFSLVASRLSARFVYGRGDATIGMAENPLAAPLLVSLTMPASVTGSCKTVTAKVLLDRPAPPAGVTVALASSTPVATVPASIAFKAGATSKSVKVITTAVPATVPVVITATLGDDMAEDTLDVKPIGVKTLTLTPTSVTGGTPVAGSVALECDAPPGDIIVTLTSTILTAAQPAVAFLTVPAGTRDGAFTVNTSSVTAVKKPKIAAATTPDATAKTKTLTVTP